MMLITDSFVEEAMRIDRKYSEAVHMMNLPQSHADGDALMNIIDSESIYKTKKKRDQLYYYITMNLWKSVQLTEAEKKRKFGVSDDFGDEEIFTMEQLLKISARSNDLDLKQFEVKEFKKLKVGMTYHNGTADFRRIS